MKIVLDTNVLISGIFWKGSPNKILELWTKDKIKILITKDILNEYIQVLHRIGKDENIDKRWSVFIAENSIVVNNRNLVKICRDSDDDKFLNCAMVGKANFLVSGDDDLLSLKKIGSIQIVKPAEFLKIFKKKR